MRVVKSLDLYAKMNGFGAISLRRTIHPEVAKSCNQIESLKSI